MLKDYEIMSKSSAAHTSQVYKQTINRFVNDLMVSGEENAPSMMRKAIRELTNEGISFVDYDSGRTMRMDTAVRTAFMNEMTNIVQEVQHKLADEIGMDGVEITVEYASAEDHADVQGRVFTNEEYEKLQNLEVATDIDGNQVHISSNRPIGMWNCRHLYFGVLIGISEPSMSKRELEFIKGENEAGFTFNGKHMSLYEGEQLQRRLEAEIRRQKETSNLYKQVKGDNPEFVKDYKESVRRTLGLQMGYAKLGKALEPHAIRTKWDRSFVIRDKQGNVPMVLQGALSDRQIAERKNLADRLANPVNSNISWASMESVRSSFTTITLPPNIDNIFIDKSRLVYKTDKHRIDEEAKIYKEVIQVKPFTDIGNTMYLSNVSPNYGETAVDGIINGWNKTELKTIAGSKYKVWDRYRYAVIDQGANNVFLKIDNPKISINDVKHQIRLVLNLDKLAEARPNYVGRIIVYLTDTRELYFFNTMDLK